MIMTGRQSVLTYWSETTHEFFDFLGSALMPWVDSTPATSDRQDQVEAAIKALRDANPGFDPLAGFDGVLLLSHPGGAMVDGTFKGWDAGSGGLEDGRPYSVISTHVSKGVFICHELGHTLGFDHTFGVDNNGGDWTPGDANIFLGPEYGSPHDLMSSASFGTRWLGTGPFWKGNPTFLGDAVADWPTDRARWRGPHLSRANLHRWYPEALGPARTVERPFPAPGETGNVRLHPPSALLGLTLLILHPPGEPASGVGRVYVEFRPASGWDIGLKQSGADLAQAGVVVHSLETVAPGVERVWYRGCVPISGVDSDIEWPGGQLTIGLDAFSDDDDNVWADVTYSLGTIRSVSIRAQEPVETQIAQIGSSTGRTPCGDEITKAIWTCSTQTFFRVTAAGFGGAAIPPTPPTVEWRVDENPLIGSSGTVDVAFDGAVFTLEYTIDPVSFELGLTSRGGERVTASIEVTVTEAGGGASSTAQAHFNARGWSEAYTPESVEVMAQCIERLANVIVIEEAQIGPPHPVERFDPTAVLRFIEQIRADQVVFHPSTEMDLELIVPMMDRFQ
jgi:hypothetical protein